MTGRTHAAVAALLYGPLVYRISGNWEAAVGGALLAAAAGLAPDFDHPHSTAAQSLGPLSGFGAFVVNRAYGHRGGLHSLAACGLVVLFVASALLLLGFPPQIIVLLTMAVNIGYLSHLLLDWLTPAGVPLLWPATDFRFSSWPLTFKANGPVNGVAIAAALGWAVFFLLLLPETV